MLKSFWERKPIKYIAAEPLIPSSVRVTVGTMVIVKATAMETIVLKQVLVQCSKLVGGVGVLLDLLRNYVSLYTCSFTELGGILFGDVLKPLHVLMNLTYGNSTFWKS